MNFKNFSFLIYGLGTTGYSVVKFLRKKKVSNYFIWDDNAELRKAFKSKVTKNLKKTFEEVDFIVLSPGISLKRSKI